MTPKKISSRKSSALAELSDLVKNAKSVAVVDYTGMSVAQATEIRKNVQQVGGEVKIAKNTLFKIALGKSDLSLQGLNAFIFSNTDEVSAVKAVADYGRKNSILAFKLGVLGDKLLTANEISALASLPSKEVLLGKLMGSITSPLYGLVYTLNGILTKFVRTLDAVSKREVTNS